MRSLSNGHRTYRIDLPKMLENRLRAGEGLACRWMLILKESIQTSVPFGSLGTIPEWAERHSYGIPDAGWAAIVQSALETPLCQRQPTSS
jgi:hypothetical protein